MKRHDVFSKKARSIFVKIVLISMLILYTCVVLGNSGFTEGFRQERVYDHQNDLLLERSISSDLSEGIFQSFESKGSKLSYVTLYLREISADNGDVMDIKLFDLHDELVISKELPVADMVPGDWNTLPLGVGGLKKGEVYTVRFSTEKAGTASCVFSPKENAGQEIFYESNIEGYGLAVGMHFVHKYVPLAYGMMFVCRMGFLLLLLFIMCFTIVRAEDMIRCYREAEKRTGYLYALFMAVSYVWMFDPMDAARTRLTEFVRMIGDGVVSGYDVSKVIGNFQQWIIQFMVAFVLFFLFMNDLSRRIKTEEQKKMGCFLDGFSLLAVTTIVFRCITYFNDHSAGVSVFYYSYSVVTVIVIAGWSYIALGVDRKCSMQDYHKFMLIGFLAAYPVAMIIKSDWAEGRLLFGCQMVFMVVMFITVWRAGEEIEKKLCVSTEHIVICLSLFPLMTTLYIESINILNQHGIFISRPRVYYALGMLMWGMAALFLAFLLRNRNRDRWERWVQPVMVVGISMLSEQVPLQQVRNAHLFESANSGVLISDFLNFGTIPIVEHYGGHMMTDVWEGIVYGILNQDHAGAIFSPYSGYLLVPVIALLFYFFLKDVWDSDMAFFVTLLFPFYGSLRYYGLGLSVILAVLGYARRNSYGRALSVWMSMIWITLYRLDLGVAFDVAGIVGLMVYVLMEKNRKAAKQLLLTLAGVVLFFGGAWSAICFVRGLSPFVRLREFILLSASNQNWAFDNIGDKSYMMYSWAYLFVPYASGICILYVFSQKEQVKIGGGHWLALVILGISYFANLQRGLVRHSLVEGRLVTIMWCACLFLALSAAYIKREKKWFLPVFTCFILLDALMIQDTNFTEVSLADAACSRLGSGDDGDEERVNILWEECGRSDGKVERILWADSLKEDMIPLGKVLDVLLEEEETFLDFMNRSFSYPALNRKDPVYISQSPLQLSGDFTQEMFIREIRSGLDDIPIAILPVNGMKIDGITYTYKYYRVAEFIYQNYRPLCSFDEFAIWVLPDRYDELAERLSDKERMGDLTESPFFIDYGYDGWYLEEGGAICRGQSHDNDLDQLALIWAESDKRNAVENTVIVELREREGRFQIGDIKNIDRSEGNYLLIHVEYAGKDEKGAGGDEDESIEASVRLGICLEKGFDERYRYNFTVKEGQHDYLFRISSDYYWYSDYINAVEIECEEKLYGIKMYILQGD